MTLSQNQLNKKFVTGLNHAYFRWDNFDWQTALNIFLNFRNNPLLIEYKIKRCVLQNIHFLTRIIENKDISYIITDIYQNSIRRADEHRFNDAVIRLKRVIELLEHNFCVDLQQLKELTARCIIVSGLDTINNPSWTNLQNKVYLVCRDKIRDFDKLREYSRFPNIKNQK